MPEEQRTERSVALRQAYGAATTRLRESRRDEFDALYQEEAEKRGVEYTPRLTPEQKAKQELNAIIAEFPHLANEVSSPS